MATHKISSPLVFNSTSVQSTNFLAKYSAFVESQKSSAILWWLGSLLIHGCALVPLTFLFVYSYGGPALPFLAISMICFFVNIIANMGGAAFKFTFNSLVFSIIVHIVMVLATVLYTL